MNMNFKGSARALNIVHFQNKKYSGISLLSFIILAVDCVHKMYKTRKKEKRAVYQNPINRGFSGSQKPGTLAGCHIWARLVCFVYDIAFAIKGAH